MMAVIAANNHKESREDALLKWFIENERAPLKMEEVRISNHRYFLCMALLKDLSSGPTLVGGRGATRIIAAIKCIAEYMERKAMIEFFRESGQKVLCGDLVIKSAQFYESKEAYPQILPPKSLQTSNGWAVHFNREEAISSALKEALERHILLYTYLKDGWEGFHLINDLTLDDFHFQSLLSPYSVGGFTAGVAIGSISGSDGVSFGYFCDNEEYALTSKGWNQALYESFDKLRNRPQSFEPSDSLSQEVIWYLTHPFEEEFNTSSRANCRLSPPNPNLLSINLQEKWNLPFEFHAAFCFGGGLIPLFIPKNLEHEARIYLNEALMKNSLPPATLKRSPIL